MRKLTEARLGSRSSAKHTKTTSRTQPKCQPRQHTSIKHLRPILICHQPPLWQKLVQILHLKPSSSPFPHDPTALAPHFLLHFMWFRHELCVAHHRSALWDLVAQNISINCRNAHEKGYCVSVTIYFFNSGVEVGDIDAYNVGDDWQGSGCGRVFLCEAESLVEPGLHEWVVR